MPRLSCPRVVFLVPFLLLAAGCQKMNLDMDVEIDERHSVQSRIIDGFRSDKKVTVTLTSDQHKFLAAVIPDALFEDFKGDITPEYFVQTLQKNSLAIAKEPATEITLTATIPASKDFRICIYSEDKNKIHMKVVSD
jgi:hypothetical protein